ncbi:MAG: hypothetical protein M0011_13710 [Elusimicrobia bacterium]|nr:hypothetical protein [Elusimicrobiota bacterium]
MDGRFDDAPAEGSSCWSCGAVIDQGDNYCRRCGKGQGGSVPWYYRHWGVILITLLGLGPFSLFYVWRSPLISRGGKQVYTALISLATVFVLYELHRIWLLYQSLLSGMQGF